MLTTITGTMKKILPGRVIKTGYINTIVMFVPAGVDDAGKLKGKDQYYPVNVFGVDAKEVQARVGAFVGRKVTVECFLNGQEYSNDEGLQYGLNLTMRKIGPGK